MPNLQSWFAYNSAITPADREAIEWLNNSQGKTYCTTEYVAPWIYSLLLKLEYTEGKADFVIWRSEPMTPKSDPANIYFSNGNCSVEGLSLLESFTYKEIEVRIYDKNN